MKKLKRNFLLLEVIAAFTLVTAMLFPMARFFTRCRVCNHEKLLEAQSALIMDKAFVHSFIRIREQLTVSPKLQDWQETDINSPDLFLYLESGEMRFIDYDYCATTKKYLEKNEKQGWLIEVTLQLKLSPRLKISYTRDVFVKV